MTWLDEKVAYNPTVPPLQLPLKFRNPTLETIPDGTLKNRTAAYLKDFYDVAPRGIGCLFLGRAGKYKTYAACLIAATVHAKVPLETLVVQCPVFVNRAERNRFSKTVEDQISHLYRVPFLVMDDFSQIRPNTFGAGLLLEVAEVRFSNLLPTIWTGNIAVNPPTSEGILQGISTLYGPSFGRRLVEASMGYGVYIK